MTKCLFIGFKGKNNSSCILVQSLTDKGYFLTNSFQGVKRDMDSIPSDADTVYMFGLDKHLSQEIRIESSAIKEGTKLHSALNLEEIADRFETSGVKYSIVDKPACCLCNEAYWHALKKFHGKAAFIHIPSLKNMDEEFKEKVKLAIARNREEA